MGNLRKHILSALCCGVASVLVCSCSTTPDDLAEAEQLLRSKPSEAKEILAASPSRESAKKSERALWCLLDVWADYNCYSAEYDLEALGQACEYFLSRRDHLRKAQAYYVRGSVYEELRTVGESQWMDDLMRGCHEVEKCSDDNLAALLWQHYGAVLNERKWYRDGIEALKKSCVHAEKAGEPNHQISSMINISHSYLFLGDADGDYSLATQYAREACELAKEKGMKDSYSRALAALASCHSRAGRFEDALQCSQEAVKVQEEMLASGKRKEPVRYIEIADAWRKLGNADSCIVYALKNYDDPSAVVRTSSRQLLYLAYSYLLHDESNALKYLSEYHRMLQERENLREDDKIAAGKVALEKEEQEQRQANILLTVLLAVLTLGAGFTIIVRVYAKRVKRGEEELRKAQEQTAEIAARAAAVSQEAARVTAQLIGKDEFIEALRDSPRYLSDPEWDRVEQTVDKVYDLWCMKLRSSGLSSGGIRAALLVKLGFSNSDAATILGISPSSFVKAKQRLKGRLPQ